MRPRIRLDLAAAGRAFGLTVLLGLGALWTLPADAQDRVPAQALTPLTVETATGSHRFQVEVADTEPARTQGLMYRQELAPDRGMLFVFPTEQPLAFWMKNTYIPLDMVFIRADGRVHRVEDHATPLSERNVESGASVRFVLELAAGVAAKSGIKRGDLVRHAAIPAAR